MCVSMVSPRGAPSRRRLGYGGDPPRVSRIDLTFTPSIWLTPADHVAVLESVQACTVMNTLREPPVIDIAMPAMRAACD